MFAGPTWTYRTANNSTLPNQNAGIWESAITGATDIVEILFGDGNTNDTTTIIQQGNSNNTGLWIGLGVAIVAIVLLILFLIFK